MLLKVFLERKKMYIKEKQFPFSYCFRQQLVFIYRLIERFNYTSASRTDKKGVYIYAFTDYSVL